ncbi:DUF1656 domain-containing protein [Novosphingobium umbonatum]|uniref:DUF1656 domain-containing protein n=1 Tax=Novosphingobium umbonatum TaxID=1908524 RepID=A0A3S2V879_9SPHN|nr:DUF1656 domain-containing protein [Novosphingobium umbonatum]RVU06133.1 DUF1656 domain-containing protein [Novosphingobium umbonatum]
MIPEYAIGSITVANAPLTATVAFLIALVIHRLLVALRFYRFVWHPVLFDTALFILIWALIVLSPVNPFQGLLS